ncbi:MAG: hypothetical protein KAH30_02355, partial [Caldisericia bacterium]|nr:hypothetical protein [Caldisericia bacterium]
LSQDESVNNKLLTLLNSIRSREIELEPGISVETLVHVDGSHKKFARFWVCGMTLLFILVGFAGTRIWPSIVAMKILEYLFTTSVHIFFLFGLFRSMIPGEFEKPIQHTLLIAVPIASAINVLSRLHFANWSAFAPTYFGHFGMTANRDWIYVFHLNNNYAVLHYGYLISLIVMVVLIWWLSKVRLKNLLAPLFFYFAATPILVFAMNMILAILSRLTSDAMLIG